jgi:Ca2+-binding EF-hand superfamily protein
MIEQKRSSSYLEQLFSKCDLDGDGVIDWHDFLLTACDKAKLFTEFNLREAFASIDFYQKNFISFDDL